jgi:hypothetical protein
MLQLGNSGLFRDHLEALFESYVIRNGRLAGQPPFWPDWDRQRAILRTNMTSGDGSAD